MHPTSTTTCWYTVENICEIESPALLVYPDRLEENIRRMVRLVGDPDRLRPHLKTVKMPEVVVTRVLSKPGPDRLCLDLGHKAIAAENTSAPRWPCMRRRWSSGAVARWTDGKSRPAIVG